MSGRLRNDARRFPVYLACESPQDAAELGERIGVSGIASRAQLRMSYLRWALVCVPGILLLGFLSGSGTRVSVATWYDRLDKPAFTPPDWVFPVVWPILYVLLGLALAIVLNARGARGRGVAVALFLAQLALNLAWTPVFFGAHQVKAAMLIIAGMIGLTIGTTAAFRRVRPPAAALMVPYLLWIVFAAALNWSILERNPDADRVARTPVSTQILR